MTEIKEIPLEIENNSKELEDKPEEFKTITEEIKELPEEVEEVPEEFVENEPIKPKAKGRPKGKATQPNKPRAKKEQPIAPIQEEPIIEAYEPSSPRRNLRIPTDPNVSDVAKAMLDLLQNQTNSRQSRRQQLHKSWFQ